MKNMINPDGELVADESLVDTDGVQQLVGRTIIAAHRKPPSGESFPMYNEELTLTLDDGSVWVFNGEGYDASALVIERKEPIDQHPFK